MNETSKMTRFLQLRAPAWFDLALKKIADERGIPLSVLIRQTLADALGLERPVERGPGRPRRPAPTGDQA